MGIYGIKSYEFICKLQSMTPNPMNSYGKVILMAQNPVNSYGNCHPCPKSRWIQRGTYDPWPQNPTNALDNCMPCPHNPMNSCEKGQPWPKSLWVHWKIAFHGPEPYESIWNLHLWHLHPTPYELIWKWLAIPQNHMHSWRNSHPWPQNPMNS